MDDAKEQAFLRQLKETFRIEAREHLQAITAQLIEIEEETEPEKQLAIIERTFREAHSLKGAARAVNMLDIETLCQAVESVFSAAKHGNISLSSTAFDLLHHTTDMIDTLLFSHEDEVSPDVIDDVVTHLNRLETTGHAAAPTDTPAPPPKTPQDKHHMPDTIRIATAKLDTLLHETEEMLSIKLTTAQRAADMRRLVNRFDLWHKEWGRLSTDLRRVQQFVETSPADSHPITPSVQKLADFLNWNQVYFEDLSNRLTALTQVVEQDRHDTGALINNLLNDAKKSLMLPFSTLLDSFPKMVRDLARAQNKKIAFTISGGEIEIDRRILEEVKAPLMHILRNCVDHGIERPEIRHKQQKPPQGTIVMSVSQLDAAKVEINISDDGAGINQDRVKAAAERYGIISAEEADRLQEQDILALIFRSALSTSAIITDISGRGLGMAIAKEKVEQLGGTIAVSTAVGMGTSFQIMLPITVSTFRGVLVGCQRQTFIMPTTAVQRVLNPNPQDIQAVQGKRTITLNGRSVPIVSLNETLELLLPPHADTRPNGDTLPLIILGYDTHAIAFSVDRILDEQEVLVKNFGWPLKRVRNVSGAAMLGSGQVVPILNPADLIKSAATIREAMARPTARTDAADTASKSILIVEDSITSRMLLKNVLEGAGYQVSTTVDGVEALTALKNNPVDLVVSDIEMPRMNGFDLAAKIKGDEALAETPVVLVTSLSSKEDKERGIDVGADAYIIKSNFDQSNLLNIIERLI